MSFSDLPLSPTPRMLRQFAAGWVVMFGAAACDQAWRGSAPEWAPVLGLVALLGVGGLLVPRSVRGLFILATVLTYPVGVVVSFLLLGVMYYAVITPLGLVLRLCGRDPLMLGQPPAGRSCWHRRGPRTPPDRYLKQF